MSIFDQDFPGHYVRLIRRVRTSIVALVPPAAGVHATLSCSGSSRTVVGGPPFQKVDVRRPPESIGLTSPKDATGVFELDPQSDLLLPFEGLGVDTSWELLLPKATNFFDYSTIADVLFTIDYSALDSGDYRQQLLQSRPQSISCDRPFSFQFELADPWYDLHHPEESATPMTVQFSTSQADFSPNLSNLKIQNLVLYFQRADGVTTEVTVSSLSFTPKGQTTPVVVPGESSINGLVSTRSIASSRVGPLKGLAPIGTWQLQLPNDDSTKQLFANEQIVDILFAITYSGQLADWPV
jgi:hypothetical protein